jgi:hypothetical protein
MLILLFPVLLEDSLMESLDISTLIPLLIEEVLQIIGVLGPWNHCLPTTKAFESLPNKGGGWIGLCRPL